MAVTGRFIRSDLAGGFNTDTTLKAGKLFCGRCFRILYFQDSQVSEDMTVNQCRFAVQNLGPKLDYTGNEESRSYLPTMARLGLGMICIWMI
jgi:hypothetical protein